MINLELRIDTRKDLGSQNLLQPPLNGVAGGATGVPWERIITGLRDPASPAQAISIAGRVTQKCPCSYATATTATAAATSTATPAASTTTITALTTTTTTTRLIQPHRLPCCVLRVVELLAVIHSLKNPRLGGQCLRYLMPCLPGKWIPEGVMEESREKSVRGGLLGVMDGFSWRSKVMEEKWTDSVWRFSCWRSNGGCGWTICEGDLSACFQEARLQMQFSRGSDVRISSSLCLSVCLSLSLEQR